MGSEMTRFLLDYIVICHLLVAPEVINSRKMRFTLLIKVRTMVIWLYNDALGYARLLVKNEVSCVDMHRLFRGGPGKNRGQ